MTYLKILLTPVLLAILIYYANGQDPLRFQEAIDAFELADDTTNLENAIVFTGSSSIRFWPALQEEFPNHNVLNRGFGGSQMSDLLYFIEELVLKYNPVKVFIYEGDNDIATGKEKKEILAVAKEITRRIHSKFPDTEINFISAKPSVARWSLKDQYIQYNYSLSLWTLLKPGVNFIDVWAPMCSAEGEVDPSLFITDNLHMNKKGYAIWKEVIQPYVETN